MMGGGVWMRNLSRKAQICITILPKSQFHQVDDGASINIDIYNI